MNYPTLTDVYLASHEQICEWHRFLQSPGISAINLSHKEFEIIAIAEKEVVDLIAARLRGFGGFTPAISKSIGWIKR